MARSRSKKSDPITERARLLNTEIAALEAQIRELGAQLKVEPAAGSGPEEERRAGKGSLKRAPVEREPVFEKVRSGRESVVGSPGEDRLRYNELGVRKFDLPGAWKRFRGKRKESVVTDPRLINYLAAGSIQGLRPLRYEKRVARNRVFALALLLVFVLWGLIAVLRG